MLKLAIIGSRKYNNKNRIHKIVKEYIKNYDITIVSGGAIGADSLAKEIALEEKITYIEFPPIHSKWNQYCFHPLEYYSKTYNVKNYWLRNKEIIDFSDHILAFVIKGVEAKGTLGTVQMAKELNKKVILFED